MNSSIEIQKLSLYNTSLKLKGKWTQEYLNNAAKMLEQAVKDKDLSKTNIMFDFEKVVDFDSAGMILIVKYINLFRQKECSITAINVKDEHKKLLIFHRKNFRANKVGIEKFSGINFLYIIGKRVTDYIGGMGNFLVFVGEVSHFFFLTLLKPLTLRFKAIVKHIELSGVKALPIVSLTSFLVGLVIAYQSSEQLQRFGANIFIVEMVSISIFRELAPMITAIVIAGRSASAYTAEIGTMKITEEIDAMRTMGFEPIIFLVLPRMIALMISMPLIVFFADLIGVYGGMIIANYQLDISFVEFIDRLHAEIPIKHIMIGLIKAPIFGLVIAAIGCFRGFQVVGSTDSIGNFTTISVVNAIFWVIALNAIISVLLTEMGI